MKNIFSMVFLFSMLCFNTICFNSCDLLRLTRFEVSNWTPGGGYHSAPENLIITLKFSLEPDKTSVERNFSMTANGNGVRGKFSWSGKTMTFSPLTPLETNTDYTLNLSANACDTDGLSMDDAFYGNFTTRAAGIRPVLISCYPSMYAQTDNLRTEILLEFSAPIPQKTLYENISFFPSMTGLWLSENKSKTAVFIPSEPWQQNTRYEMRVSSSLTDNNGMSIGKDFISVFTTGTDRVPPHLLSAKRIADNGEVYQLISDSGYTGAVKSPAENAGWERNDKLLLVFSKPVDSVSLKNSLISSDGPGFILETGGGYHSEFIIRLDSAPVYNSRFSIKVKPGIKDSAGNESMDEHIFLIHANGEKSQPPFLSGLRIPMAPNNELSPELRFFGSDSLFEFIPISDNYYPSGESIKTWIELYFSTARGAEIDAFSVMELFRTETSNNVINFSARHVKTDNFTISQPHPGMENYQRIEITGFLINSTFSGIINFQIAAGLRDSYGNRNENLQRITVIK